MSDRIIFREGKKVILRPLNHGDIPLLQKWMNDPGVTRFLLRTTPMMEQAEKEWLDNLSKDQSNYAFGIELKDKGGLIGTIGLHRISWVHRSAMTGAMIGRKEDRGHGYGTDAKMLLLDYAFNALDLHIIESRVLEDNVASLTYAKKSGYVKCGRIPQMIRRLDGTRGAEVILYITQKIWRPHWKKYKAELDEMNKREQNSPAYASSV